MKQYIAIVLAMLMIATPLSVFSGAASSAEIAPVAPLGGGTFGGGDGSAGNPYIITDVLDLQAMGGNLGANYTLGNDIDATNTSISGNPSNNGGLGFAPVGTDINKFTGNLDGRNYTITGLYINRSTADHVGLFGWGRQHRSD
jgi:hypothetical protein